MDEEAQKRINQAKEDEDRCEILLWASARGLKGDAENLVSMGTKLQHSDKRGLTALHYAASHGRDEIVEFLCVKGADIDAECQIGRMPIHYAAATGQYQATKILLSKKAWSDSVDSHDDTPLHLAARKGDASVCKLILEEGSISKCLEMRNKRGLTPLGEALAGNHVEAMEVFIQQGAMADVLAQGFNLVHLSCGIGLTEPLVSLFDSKRSKANGSALKLVNHLSGNKDAICPLHAAVLSLSVGCIKLLLKNGADAGAVSSSGQTPLDLLNWNSAKKGTEKDEEVEEIKSLLVSAMSKRPKNEAQKSKHQQPVKIVEPAALTFESLPRLDQIKRVEALSHQLDISSLNHLNETARKALLEISRVSKVLDSMKAIAAFRKDTDYQKDVQSDHVKKAMMDIQQTNDMSKYRDDSAVLQVCSKLNKLQALLRSLGCLPPNVSILQETLAAKEGPNSIEETDKRISALELTRDSLIVRCVVEMGGRSKDDCSVPPKGPPLIPKPDPEDKASVPSSDNKWLHRIGRDVGIQIMIATLMAVFALLWIKAAANNAV